VTGVEYSESSVGDSDAGPHKEARLGVDLTNIGVAPALHVELVATYDGATPDETVATE